MSTSQLVNELQSCPLYIDLFTKDETAIFLGKTKVHLGNNFVDVVESSPSCADLPISAFMRLATFSGLRIGRLLGQIWPNINKLLGAYENQSCKFT